tara:strand:- start:471 stop:644 length:174 start_codon:yes stop_codon:yes gene_type:complete
MPTVATQTDISTIADGSFKTWCRQNMDLVDGLTGYPVDIPKAHIYNINNTPLKGLKH